MQDGLCPKCNTRTVYTHQGVLGVNGSKWEVGLRMPKAWLSTSPLQVYICTTCGYVETYLADRSKVSDITKHWQRV